MKIQFQAQEYTSDDTFQTSEYQFEGDESQGWEISRNGQKYLSLGSGYRLLKTKSCGVCSTDLDRRFLPFPLPQITGHELVAEDVENGKVFTVEINDTDSARGEKNPDIFCKLGIPTHSPTRKVLGIDRLPGGFGKYILAPVHACVPIGNVSEKAAVLTEPFAAALQAVICSPPPEGSEVAVLGPRRLGMLLIAALSGYRSSQKRNFRITAISRHDHLLELGKKLGADSLVNIKKTSPDTIKNSFDIVYDTTASPEGFLNALEYSKKQVHLKSTNGQVVSGIKKMTEMVVDEISLLPFSSQNLDFHWPNDVWKNQILFAPKHLEGKLNISHRNIYYLEKESVSDFLKSEVFANRLPRFDLAIASSEEEIDFCLRPNPDSEESLVRPRGAILYYGDKSTNPLLQFLQNGGELRSSRCGDFHLALQILEENPELAKELSNSMISHELHSSDLEKAFQIARDSSSVKVVVNHS